MSFSSEAKNEIAQRKITKPCCARAAAFAVACFGKYFDARGVVLQTELPFVAQFAKRELARCGVEGQILEKLRPSGALYEFSVKEEAEVKKLHALFGTTGKETSLQIDPLLLCCPDCVRAFVATAFLCSGTVTDPEKEYNLEFLSSRFHLSRDMEGLLAEHEFCPHRTCRKGTYIVYIKASSNIEDILTFMGASNASLKIMDQKVYRSLRNQTNRRTNCDTANLEKTAQASAQTLRAIRYLEKNNLLDGLSEPLRQAARVRLASPDESLAVLCARMEPPVSKSGLSHRMKKLEALAANHQSRKAEEAEHV